jgi:hypothetical protein
MEILVMQCSRTSSSNFLPKSRLSSQLHVFRYSQCVSYLYVEDQYSYPFEAIGYIHTKLKCV